ncbi:MAG: hypothetical protein GEV12_18020 [Micromonosporaceae bacterium]|nr:hypothetical protein [Micromonosporaceae bacterium]
MTGQQPTRTPSNTLGLLALILGIAALPLVFCFGLALPVGLAAVVLGGLSLRRGDQARADQERADQPRAGNRRQAVVGMVCGGLAAFLMLVTIALPN